MKRLIFFIFTIICATILYTCSPLAAEGLTAAGVTGTTYYSGTITGNTETILGVNVQSETEITIGLYTNTNSSNQSIGGTSETISSVGTNSISGTYPNISFYNGAVSGTIRFIDETQLKITFQQHISPYFKMWDVICSK